MKASSSIHAGAIGLAIALMLATPAASFPLDPGEVVAASATPFEGWEGTLTAVTLPAAVILALLLLLSHTASRRRNLAASRMIEALRDLREGRSPSCGAMKGGGPLGRLSRELDRFASELLVARREGEDWIRELERGQDGARAQARRAGAHLATTSRRLHPSLDALVVVSGGLAATELGDDQRELVETLESEARTLRGIVDDLHLLARIEEGQLPARGTAFDLFEAVEQTAEEFATTLRGASIDLVMDIDPHLPRVVTGYPLRLKLALGRLLEHTGRAAGTEHLTITLGAAPERQGIPRFSLAVTGGRAGLEAQQPSTSVESSGPGEDDADELALTVVVGLVEAMGGDVLVESCPEHGTRVALMLPGPPPMERADVPVAVVPAYRRVLVVDDLAPSRRAIGTLLARLKLKVETASGADWALSMLTTAAAEGNPFDLLLVDAQLNGGEGMELVRRVRAKAGISEIAVLLLVPPGVHFEENETEAAGILAVLSRPVRLDRWSSLLLRPEVIPVPVEPDPPLPAGEPAAQPLLLLVAGSPTDREITERTLGEIGCRVAIAAHGAEAQEQLAKRTVDLVLIDCRAPDLDGFGISRAIRALPEPTASMPIIAFTDNATIADHGACMTAGIDDCLPASIAGHELARALARHLREWVPAGR